jgi:Zn-dependent protease
MFITPIEIFDIIVMTLAIGYIFSDYLKKPLTYDVHNPVKYFSINRHSVWENTKFAAMIASPAIVLHELAHKFVAMGFGATAVLHAPYGMYLVVVILKLIKFPFIFFVGGYVSHSPLPALQSSLVSVAGPFMNFLIWFACWILVKNSLVNKKYYKILVPMGRISLFLAIFNMLPIPGFDGSHFFSALFSLL